MYVLDEVTHPNFPCENYYAGRGTLRVDGESHTGTVGSRLAGFLSQLGFFACVGG